MGPVTKDVEAGSKAERSDELSRFGARVREHRERAGLTQAELAERAGIDRIAVSLIERGQRDVGVTRAAAIARALGVLPGDLFPDA